MLGETVTIRTHDNVAELSSIAPNVHFSQKNLKDALTWLEKLGRRP